MEYIIIGILVLILIVLSCLYLKKHVHNTTELIEYQQQLAAIKLSYDLYNEQCEARRRELEEIEKKIHETDENYSRSQESLDIFFTQQKTRRQAELDAEFEQQIKNKQQEFNQLIDIAQKQTQEAINAAQLTEQNIQTEIKLQQQRYESLLAPLRQYEKDKQDKLFYTIQVPDEYKSDIDYLLREVSPKIQHPDIINKLIWAEYVKPYIDETFKRAGIEDKAGIYKITNIENGKAYIGKSTNIKKRIIDHFKSSIGITNIADQAVHHAILKTGFWNWLIECVIYCDKEQLNEMEKYYINFFKTQDFGYNKNAGGGG